MARTFRTYAPLLMTFVIMLLPLMPLVAMGAEVPTAPGNVNIGNGTAPGTVQVGGSTCFGSSCELKNPLKVSNFCQLVKTVLDAILIIGMPVAVVFLVWVGFKFILAQGNPEALKKAQQNFLYTVIGIAIFLGAWTIAKIIASTLQGLGVSAVNECVR